MQLHERVALVVNADTQPGPAIVARLAHEGAHVVAQHDGPASQVAYLEGLARPHGPQLVPLQAALAEPEAVAAAFGHVRQNFGRLDVLVFNCRPKQPNTLASTDAREWRRDIDEDLTAFHRCAKEVSRIMVAQKRGKIIPVFFGVGARGEESLLSWSACSGGMMGLVKCLAVELLRYRVNVNGVAYGFVDEVAFPGAVRRTLDRYCHLLGVPRAGTCEDLASAVYFLASSDSDYLTGLNLSVSGGLLL